MLPTGEVTSDKSTIYKPFNSFFVNIGPTLTRSFDGYIGSPQKYLTNRQINSLFLCPVTNNEIHKILDSRNDSAPGHDEIRLGPVKSVLQYIDGPFTYICNLSLNQGVFFYILKISNVIPLYKKEDPLILSNYRPVSLLCSLSKVLEKLLTAEWYHFWMKMMYYPNINLVSVNRIPLTLRQLCWWINQSNV